jgi:hypothetical protein
MTSLMRNGRAFLARALRTRSLSGAAMVAAITALAMSVVGVSTVSAVGPTLPPRSAAPTTKAATTGGGNTKAAPRTPAKAPARKTTAKKTTAKKPTAKRVPLFSLVASPSRRRIGPGDGTKTQIDLKRGPGFSGVVAITASGVPRGVSLEFPGRIREFAPVVITTDADVKEGSYRIVFKAVQGSRSNTVTFNLVINEAYLTPGSDDTLPPVDGPPTTVDPNAPTTLPDPNATTTTTVAGSTGSSTTSTSTTTPGLVRSLVSTSLPSPGTPAAGTPTTLGAGDFALAFPANRVVLPAGGSTTFSVNISGPAGTAPNPLFVVSGLPAGVTSAIGATLNGVVRVTLNAPATQPASTGTVTMTGSESGRTKSAAAEFVVVTDMGISLNPSTLTAAPGASAQASIVIANVAAFTAPVALSIAGLPAGVSPQVAGQGINNASTVLTLSVAATVPVGAYPITITGTGGGVTRSVTGSLVVGSPAPSGAATVTGIASTVAPTGAVATVLGANNGELTLTVTPAQTSTAVNGGAASYAISVIGTALSAGPATISVAGLPSNVRSSVTPNPTTGAATLTLSSGIPGATGAFAVTVTATVGSASRSQVVQLTLS